MMSLRDRIHDQLEPQIVRFLRGKPRLKLVPIVGNGITRMAGGDSWDKWIRKVLGIVDQPERFDALRRKGFEHPEILNYAFEKATESHLQEMWRQFAAQLYGLSPSNLHQAIALMADCHIATTNYDDLLERGAGDRYNPDYVIKPESKLPDPYAPQPGDVVISKLHGSLPPKDELEEWIKNKGYDNLITTSVSYKKAVFRPKGTPGPFVRLEEALEQDDHIFLFLGTSLTPAELFLFRILYRRQNPPDNLATLHFGSDADPPIRLEELGIKPFTVHRGLASSADRRKLAYLVLLKLLLDKIDIPDDRKAKADESLRNGHAALPCNLLVNRRLGEISPVVGCIGPLQVSRVIGIKTAPQEEAFFGPVEGSAEPGSAQTEDLISDAAIGQGGNPLLVWDALGLPSAAVAEVGNDSAGDQVLERLSELKWTDFDGVLKILPRRGAKPPVEASPGFATESMTAITWFGVRTGFDARRFVAKGRLLRADGWKQEFEKLSGVAILYATKVLSYYLRLHFDDVFAASKPLVIFETGGSGDADIDDWVATNEGIVIASARAALKNWFGVDTEDKIPHDMFGRYWQIKLLLEALPNNAFPQGSPLARARALVVTLGEVGALYWERTNPEWQWCFAKSFEEHSKQGFADAVTLPLEEIRDALGCGDCSRAGFVASMACSLGFRPPDQDLPPQSLSLAVASLNWFGIQKLRYFGMDRYIKFLAREADGFWEKWRASPSGTQKQFGTEPFETLDTRPALEKKTGQLDVTLGGWLAKFDPEKPAEIQKLSNKWSSTRRESRPI